MALAVIFSGFLLWKGWELYGQYNESGILLQIEDKNELEDNDEMIFVEKNRRVPQGEKFKWSELVQTKDTADFTFSFYDKKGRKIQSEYVDTSKIGCFEITVRIQNKATGKKWKENAILLVDGRCL